MYVFLQRNIHYLTWRIFLPPWLREKPSVRLICLLHISSRSIGHWIRAVPYHKHTQGLFKYHRLANGISTAPDIFQHTMDQILQGLQHSPYSNKANTCWTVILKQTALYPSHTAEARYICCCSQTSSAVKTKVLTTHLPGSSDHLRLARRSLCETVVNTQIMLGFQV